LKKNKNLILFNQKKYDRLNLFTYYLDHTLMIILRGMKEPAIFVRLRGLRMQNTSSYITLPTSKLDPNLNTDLPNLLSHQNYNDLGTIFSILF
jgi:hypothetical protein